MTHLKTDLTVASTEALDAALDRLYGLHYEAETPERAEIHYCIDEILTELRRRNDDWLATKAEHALVH